MNIERLGEVVDEYFESDVKTGSNLYFKTYYSTRPVHSVDFREFLSEEVSPNEIDLETSNGKNPEVVIRTGEGHVVVIFGLPYDNWLVVYTSALEDNLRDKFGRLGDSVGWLTNGWVPSETVEHLYEEYSKEAGKVTIKRRWDPYYIYKHYSSIPPEMQEYYEENLPKFEEQETEFSLRTPRWMVDDVLDSQLSDEFIKRSEVAESRFNVPLSNPGEAGVTVDQSAQVTHRFGEPKATLKVVTDVLERDQQLHSEFEDVVPQKEFTSTSGGMLRVDSYEPPKILRLRFPQSEYDEESNIKLSNLLTVGQSDANFHGYISDRDELDFRCRSYNTFDRSEFEIKFTQYQGDPTLYVRPVEATVEGVINLYQTLKSKFDTTVERDTLEEMEYVEG